MYRRGYPLLLIIWRKFAVNERSIKAEKKLDTVMLAVGTDLPGIG